jgi:hypothetical protein
LNAKPILNLWYYLVIYLTPFIPLSFEGEGDKKKRGAKPLLDTLRAVGGGKGEDMSVYEEILNFEEKLRAKYKQEFVEEIALACELFDIFFEANDINLQQWRLRPERRATVELISRTFNDLHAGLKLISEGMPAQGIALLRDTIECANHIKLFESDSEFRDKWCQGECFFPRDIQNRMRKLKIPPPSLNEEYKPLSQAFVHPSKAGVASHTADLYSPEGEHSVLFSHGGVDDVCLIRSAILLAIVFIYKVTCFVWGEMYPIDKDTYPQWHKRVAKALERIYSLQDKVKQEQLKYHIEQYTTAREILNDYFRLLQ